MTEAMTTIGLDEDEKQDIFALALGILHLGNVIFAEERNDQATVDPEQCKLRILTFFS